MPGGDTSDADGIYVAHIHPDARQVLVHGRACRREKVQALGNLVVRKKSVAPSVGDQAIPSKTPTLASTGGDLAALTTARHPDRALYEVSVAQAIAAHEPFVLAFATPQFCQSRTCGPVVDVVSAVRKQPASKGIRFIHVESTKTTTPRTASTSGSTSGGSRPSRSRSSSTARVWSAQSSKARSLPQSSSARSPRAAVGTQRKRSRSRGITSSARSRRRDLDTADDRRRHLPRLAHHELRRARDLVGDRDLRRCELVPAASVVPRRSRSGAIPATPSATSVVPCRQARPNESLTITPDVDPGQLAQPLARGARPSASGSSGSRTSPRLGVRGVDPRGGADEPCRVSAITSGGRERTTSRLSRRITST